MSSRGVLVTTALTAAVLAAPARLNGAVYLIAAGVPEPSAYALLGLVVVTAVARRRTGGHRRA